ncbi:ATP-binding protein, partial [Balneolaceae bacterium ANBcel3]|nr:ATP-binding protein [Balneolaceae bacterium ANBcel3]
MDTNQEKTDLRFKVNLEGMIDLFSNHLYSTPKVFVRELLQNAVDAITARKKREPHLEGAIYFELHEPSENNPGTLIVEDNGIGLTEEEVHQFLAIIGQSSKKKELFSNRDDFIGQFGIGLLSCFMVCNEIVLITSS